jgi:cobalt-zinc-cadmium efflux system outer membrane protein
VGVEREGDGSRRVGPQVSLELPVFQQGQGRVARDIAALAQARAAERSIELAIDAELQQQLQRVGIAHAAAEGYRSGLIPQREAIVAQMQQRTNQMLVDTFALLLARQQEQAAYDGYVDAVQDYWRSRVALLQAVGTQLVAALPPKMEDQP